MDLSVGTQGFIMGSPVARGGFQRGCGNSWSGGRIESPKSSSDIVARGRLVSSKSFPGMAVAAAYHREATNPVEFGHAQALLNSRKVKKQTSEELRIPEFTASVYIHDVKISADVPMMW